MFIGVIKKRKLKNLLAVTLLFFFVTPLLSSCVSGLKEAKGVTVTQLPACCAHPDIRRVAVLDFMELSPDPDNSTPHVCPVTGLNFIPGMVQQGSGETVGGQLRQQLRAKGFVVIDPELVQNAMKDMKRDYSVKSGIAIGRKVGADILFMGTVIRYEEMVGSKIAVEKPASVSFSVALLSVSSNKIIWTAKFEKTQKSFFGNIFDFETFFKGGMVWQKAGKLSDIGVQNVVDRIPFSPAKSKDNI